MATSRFLEWFPLAALAGWGMLALTRGFWLGARGVRVIVVDGRRTVGENVVDAAALVCFVVWACEVIAFGVPLRFHIWPSGLSHALVENIGIKVLGAVFIAVSGVLYAAALRDLGASWRVGIDRTKPGPLVTGGIYGWTRHPIYVAMDLLFIGTFFIHGRVVFLVLAMVWLPLMHGFMRREERFLSQVYGGTYYDYCGRVGRYFSWHRPE